MTPSEVDALIARHDAVESVLRMTSAWARELRAGARENGHPVTAAENPAVVARAFQIGAVQTGLVGTDISVVVRTLRKAGGTQRELAGYLTGHGAVRRVRERKGRSSCRVRYVVPAPEPWVLVAAATALSN